MASEISASLAEVISSLEPIKIPDKLHCPHCDGFLLNGYKLSCCDQSICETCYPKLSDRCLICEHEPFTQELCKPNVGLRKTAKAFLKTQEKKIADERAKAQAATIPAKNPERAIQQNGGTIDESSGRLPVLEAEDVQADGPASSLVEDYAGEDPRSSPEIVTDSAPTATPTGSTNPDPSAAVYLTSRESPIPAETAGNEQLSQDDVTQPATRAKDSSQSASNGLGVEMNMNGFPNLLSMNAGVNIMDPNQMMQYLNANGMNGFSTMMGMPNMNINQMPQGMFGGFGGPGMGMNGMNGMNMGMNFNPNAGMFGGGWNGQNNNMWNGPQSNNPNAFSNGIGGDFGSNTGYGYNMSQSANFHQQQQHPQGDFGYYGRGRGRGRGRGGFNRTRNGFNNFSQANQPHFQNAHEQQQYEIQNMQAQMLNGQPSAPITNDQKPDSNENETDQAQAVYDDDEFAPGGQDEVQEALGADYHRSEIEESKEQDAATDTAVIESIEGAEQNGRGTDAIDLTPAVDGQPGIAEAAPAQSPKTYEDAVDVPVDSPNKGATNEEPKPSMPPPSAPSGPASQQRELEDFGFRARGHNKFASRSRGSFSGMNSSPISPMKAPSQAMPVSPVDTKGVGVIGAPTGPRAMRESSAPKPARPLSGSISNTGGFKIMGRASMASQDSERRESHRSRSNTPAHGGANHLSEPSSASRQQSRHSGHESSRYDAEPYDDYDRDYDCDRKRSRKSRKDEYSEMQDADRQRSRSKTPIDRKSSHRSRRDKDRDRDRDRDRDHHTSSSRKHASSRSHRDVNGDKTQDLDAYGTSASRDNLEFESRSSHRGHRSSKSSKYNDRDREDRHRDRDGRRKRSRQDRDYDDDQGDDDDSSCHRSRRHKREHRDESTINGHGTCKSSHHSSEAATPVDSEREKDKNKDPHTLEREARNRERMEKEMQRRANARQDDRGSGQRRDNRISGGRKVSYKREEDLQSSIIESERDSARWR